MRRRTDHLGATRRTALGTDARQNGCHGSNTITWRGVPHRVSPTCLPISWGLAHVSPRPETPARQELAAAERPAISDAGSGTARCSSIWNGNVEWMYCRIAQRIPWLIGSKCIQGWRLSAGIGAVPMPKEHDRVRPMSRISGNDGAPDARMPNNCGARSASKASLALAPRCGTCLPDGGPNPANQAGRAGGWNR